MGKVRKLIMCDISNTAERAPFTIASFYVSPATTPPMKEGITALGR